MLLAGVVMFPIPEMLTDSVLLSDEVFRIAGMVSDSMLLVRVVVFPISELLSDALLLRDVVFRIVGILSDSMSVASVMVFPIPKLLSDSLLLRKVVCINVEYVEPVLASFVVVYRIAFVFADSAAPAVQ
jgi:hypothetical protein